MPAYELIIPPELDGSTIRRAATGVLGLSSRQFKRCKFQGEMRLDGMLVHADARLRAGQRLWLYAPDTPIDYPVVKCRSNSYYLDRMFNRKQNPAGTLFIDMRNLPDFDDPNTLIYGHHMRDGSMFHSLTDYDAPGFYDAHPFMLAVSETEIYLIEVFAGYVTTSKDHCYDIAISDEQDMRAFVEEAQRKSDFASHVEIDCGADRLVTLSTCAYNFENARYVVIGRLATMWEGE